MTDDILNLTDITCRYDDRLAVRGLSLRVPRGSIVGLLGPSGCGKTTVLRAIAGFHPLEGGEIHIGDRLVSAVGFTLPPEKRRLGVVFQDYALFPHLTVAGNVGFGLRQLSRAERRRVVTEMLALVGLPEMAERYPHELSGGQQQRVALARALAAKPDLVLFDEPFSSLDVELRERLSGELREILKRQGTSAVLVTHDQHEAFAMGDQVGIMHDGRLVQWDTPYNLYHQPCCRFVADFIGQGVFLKGTLLTPDTVETELGIYKGHRPYGWSIGTPVDVLLRPDDIIPDPEGPLRGEIIHKAFKGAEILYTLRLPTGGRVLSLFPSHADHALGSRLGIRVQADHLIAFPRHAPGTQVPPA
ncbi:MAG: iron ABC transporter ATP-binding protein [Candidatus Muproteobacteria bacterium RBG_16_62_13]|uniref:Iron ABC transporter ATP-binding protein n=1 Tax=Candidatus Muproteobacteria bacterium RBG_16_62_13 TaxID=1817756 RepID=A0A1F6SY99_9PROT|nr:MAG: iron ABC transporter ATP-binding protein [Candidatus Muproteobacteria bacterium RBG_16_62_13]